MLSHAKLKNRLLCRLIIHIVKGNIYNQIDIFILFSIIFTQFIQELIQQTETYPQTIYKMNINAWNLSQTKTTFFIRERTEAQRRHLKALKNAKSHIDLQNTAYLTNQFAPLDNSRSFLSKSKDKYFDHISHATDQEQSIMSSANNKTKMSFIKTSYFQNLRTSTSMSRIRHHNQIQKENCKLLTRIVKAKPSISDIQFKKNHISHLKYKQNILKTKFSDINPDYTKVVNSCKKSRVHMLLKPIQNLSKLQQSTVKTRTFQSACFNPKSENYRYFKKLSHTQASIMKEDHEMTTKK